MPRAKPHIFSRPGPVRPASRPAGPDSPPGRPGWKKAMTLVELLVAMLMGLIVFSVVIAVFFSSANNYTRQEQILAQMQNLRVGLHSVAVDARMAGSGFAMLGDGLTERLQFYDEKAGDWFKYEGESEYGARAIYGVDGGDGGSDSVTICWLAPEFGSSLGVLEEDFTYDSGLLKTRIALSDLWEDNIDWQHIFNAGDKWAVVNPEGEAVIVEYLATEGGGTGGRYRVKALPRNFPDGLSFPVGSKIYNVREIRLVTYFIDELNRNLMANLHGQDFGDADEKGAVVEAPGFEDLQAIYFLRGENTAEWTNGHSDLKHIDLKANPIQALQLSAIHRSPERDPYHGGHKAISLYNRIDVEPTADGHPRRVLSETVTLRNRIR
ncbi:MAG: hypothetical protein LBP33_10770 [Candidatus Adiutrix sp.]|nr:hypothetical protein [Candidatus Adiutrix sp.]